MLQALWRRRGLSSAVEARTETPKASKGMWDVGRGFLREESGEGTEGLCPLPRKFFGFWCILGRIFTVELLVYHLR